METRMAQRWEKSHRTFSSPRDVGRYVHVTDHVFIMCSMGGSCCRCCVWCVIDWSVWLCATRVNSPATPNTISHIKFARRWLDWNFLFYWVWMTSAAAYPSYRMELSHTWHSDQVIRAGTASVSCILTLIRHLTSPISFSWSHKHVRCKYLHLALWYLSFIVIYPILTVRWRPWRRLWRLWRTPWIWIWWTWWFCSSSPCRTTCGCWSSVSNTRIIITGSSLIRVDFGTGSQPSIQTDRGISVFMSFVCCPLLFLRWVGVIDLPCFLFWLFSEKALINGNWSRKLMLQVFILWLKIIQLSILISSSS